jgi:hypothetical protein
MISESRMDILCQWFFGIALIVRHGYVKRDLDLFNKTGVTLFFAHDNGFPKEVSYEYGS